MELRLIGRFMRRWWLVIALPALVALVWSLPTWPDALFPPETYGGSIRFAVAAPPSPENAQAAASDALPRSGTYEDTAYVPWLASEYVVVNMPSWVTSSHFAAEVSAQLATDGLDITPEAVQPAFAADSARSTLTVYYGWDDQAELEAIMAASITVLQTRNQAYFPQLAAEPATVVPLDRAEAVRTVPPLTTRLAPLVRVGLGLGVGLGLALLAAYLDDRVYARADLHALDIEVLAAVPRE